MGQAESKEADQNPNQIPPDLRRNTVHGTERTRRPTPPIANPISQLTTDTKRTPATSSAPSPQRPANTPQTFPRARGLTNVRPRMSPLAASQRQATTTARTNGRLQQRFAVRPAKTAESSVSSPVLPTPTRSQPIPISQPSTRSRPERILQDRGRPTVRRSAPPTKVAAQATGSDQEPVGPPAKRVTRSTAQPATDKTAATPAPAANATAGPSTTKTRLRDVRPLDDEPTDIGDVELAPSADSGDKMSISTESDSSDDESDDATSQSSDESEDPNELGQDLELDVPDADSDETSGYSEGKSDVSDESAGGLLIPNASRRSAARPVSPRAAPRPASPRAAPRPVSPRAAPRPVSPRATPRPVSPSAAPRPVSPRAAPRPASPREAPRPVSSRVAPKPASPRAVPKPVSSRAAPSPVSPRVAATAAFELRRSRRRSVPVRHLQVDPHRVSYVSV